MRQPSGDRRADPPAPAEPSNAQHAGADTDDEQEHADCHDHRRTLQPPGPPRRRRRRLPRPARLRFALGSSEAHQEATTFALVLRPLPAVLIGVEPPGRQVRVQGVDGLQRRLEAPLDLLDAAHVIPVGWLAA